MESVQNQRKILKNYLIHEDEILFKFLQVILAISGIVTLFFWILVFSMLGGVSFFDGAISFIFFLLPAIVGSILTSFLYVFKRVIFLKE